MYVKEGVKVHDLHKHPQNPGLHSTPAKRLVNSNATLLKRATVDAKNLTFLNYKI